MRLVGRWLPAVVAVAIVGSGALAATDHPSANDPNPSLSRAPLIRRADDAAPTAKTAASPVGASPVGASADRRPETPTLDPRRLPDREGVRTEGSDPHTLVVRFAPGTTEKQMQRMVRDAGGEPVSTIPALTAAVVSVAEGAREQIAAALERADQVGDVEPNRIRHAFFSPNDPGFYDQGHLHVSRLPAAWEVSRSALTQTIAILDTGVDLDHPDFLYRIKPGYDFVNNDADPMDDEGHGTMVAGIAAASTDNGVGVTGASFDAWVLPVKVMGSDGTGSDATIAQGIVWAADHGADVINLSLGAPGESALLEDAVAYALQRGVSVVAAAGNASSSEPNFPAALPGVIAVGATDLSGEVAPFTNFGPWVDLVAPGTDIISTYPAPGGEEAYAIGDGTSFAAPIVAGVAALVNKQNTTWTPTQIANKITLFASDRGPQGIDDSYGHGLLDAYGAVSGRTAIGPPRSFPSYLEPNDAPDRATSVATPVPLLTIDPEGDVDWFSVDASAPGTLSFRLNWGSPSELPFVPVVSIYSGELDLLKRDRFVPEGGSVESVLGLTQAGRYYVKVQSDAPTRSPNYTATAALSLDVLSSDPAGERLWVRSATPADFHRFATTTAQPTITFARSIDPVSITGQTARLLDGTTGVILSSARTYNASTRTITLAPSTALKPGKAYLIDVRGLKDVDGNTMTEPYRSRFSVKAATATTPKRADVNGDGYDDLIVGAPNEDLSKLTDAGAVHVMYGSASGVKTSGSQWWTQDTPNMPEKAEAGDQFGASIATGDVNNDGYDDVAIGVPGENIGSVSDAGLVHLLLGSSSGLRAAGSQIWTQNSTDVGDVAETGDKFGASLVFGDFDLIPGEDLAIGSPGEKVATIANAGMVHVLVARGAGLKSEGFYVTQQRYDLPPVGANAFGLSLAAGDFDGDSHDDLAIGAPFQDVGTTDDGTVSILRGTIYGLRHDLTVFSEMITGVPASAGERFGLALAAGDFGGFASTDGYDDLAVGAPGANAGAGRVDILYSDWIGPGYRTKSLTQTGAGGPEPGDAFGAALGAGNVMGSLGSRLVIGAPGEDIGTFADAGAIQIGETSSLSQGMPRVPDTAEAGDRFGASLRVLDVDRDGAFDVVAGSPTEKVGTAASAGIVHVLRRAQSPTSIIGTVIAQGSNGVPEAAQTGDRFGLALGG